MKTLLLAATVMVLSTGAQARSILVFKTTSNCISAVKESDAKVTIQEAQDGQTQLVLKLSVQEDIVKVQTKKILPPPMSAGTPLKYKGSDKGANVELVMGTRPVKVGSVTGRSATLTIDGRYEKLALVCSSVK